MCCGVIFIISKFVIVEHCFFNQNCQITHYIIINEYYTHGFPKSIGISLCEAEYIQEVFGAGQRTKLVAYGIVVSPNHTKNILETSSDPSFFGRCLLSVLVFYENDESMGNV